MTTPSALTEEALKASLAGLKTPDGRDLLASGLVQSLSLRGSSVTLILDIGDSDATALEPVRSASEQVLKSVPGVTAAQVILTAESKGQGQAPAPRARHAKLNAGAARETAIPPTAAKTPLPGIAAIIAVASGKGGVGKSTVAVNLALALKALGLRAGLLDADIYGPSLPMMLGLKDKPVSKDGKNLEAMDAHGLKAMSVGLLVDPDQPMIWRGPVATTALMQLLNDVNWGPLDVLVIDMPPGTGDIQLTLAQRVPLSGAVIVSTPQDIALIDARKGLAMFRRVAVPVLGFVENMSVFVCPNCGHAEHIFGEGGARAAAAAQGVPLLAEIPLRRAIREGSDQGTPIMVSAPSGPEAQAFLGLADQVMTALKASPPRPAPRILMLP